MREILFKGKRVDNGEWVEGYFVAYKGMKNESYIFEPSEVEKGFDLGGYLDCCKMTEVIPESVGHYTGITDKNGTKIFEGDILNAPHWWWGCGYVYLVRVSKGYGHADSVSQYILAKNVENPLENAAYNLWNGSEVEVIGNIHDNPELLVEK